jgi:hypothetical protein
LERRRGLELTRSRILADLDASRLAAHRTMLRHALEAVEREMAALATMTGPA